MSTTTQRYRCEACGDMCFTFKAGGLLFPTRELCINCQAHRDHAAKMAVNAWDDENPTVSRDSNNLDRDG